MDITSIVTTATAIGTGVGGFIGGKVTSRMSLSQIASETVDMLQTQVDLLREGHDAKESEIQELRSRVEVLENLVTQRAEVEELSGKVTLVKDTVDRIAIKVGA